MLALVIKRKAMARLKPATIRACFEDHTGPYVMMFGTSYKTWWDQLEEFCRLYKTKPKDVTICRKEWISFGGLKWCDEMNFQGELDKEGKGRKTEEFVFGPLNRIEANCLRRVRLSH